MKKFYEYIENKKPTILLENQLLDKIIFELGKPNLDPSTIKSLTYDYIAKNSEADTAVKNMITSDPKKYTEYNTKYKQLLDMVANKLKNSGYTFVNNGAWAQYNRGDVNPNAKKDDNMTTKRYITLAMNDIWKAFQALPTLGEALNNVKLRPESNHLSFKVGGNYGTVMHHKDTIVIHFYDKNAGQQVDQAVNTFLNAAGVKESNREQIGRVNFGKDAGGTSDSDIVADRISKYFVIHKKEIPNMLKMPNFKDELKKLIDNLSMKSSHRAGVVV